MKYLQPLLLTAILGTPIFQKYETNECIDLFILYSVMKATLPVVFFMKPMLAEDFERIRGNYSLTDSQILKIGKEIEELIMSKINWIIEEG